MRKILIVLILAAPSLLKAESRPGFIGDDVWDETQSILSLEHSREIISITEQSFNNGLLSSTNAQTNKQFTTIVNYTSKREANASYHVGYSTSDTKTSGSTSNFSEFQLGYNLEAGQNTFAFDYGRDLAGDNYNDRLSVLYSFESGDLTTFVGVNAIQGLQGSQDSLNFHRMIGMNYDYRSDYADKFFTVQISKDDQSTMSNKYLTGVARYLFKNNKPYFIGIEGIIHKAFNGYKADAYKIGAIFALELGKGQFAFTPALNISSAYETPTYSILRSDYMSYRLDYNLELPNNVFLNASIQLSDQAQDVHYALQNNSLTTNLDRKTLGITLTKLLD